MRRHLNRVSNRRHLYEIRDQDLLKDLTVTILAERFEGSQSRAAKETEISQATWSRWTRGQAPRMTDANREKLQELLGFPDRFALWSVFLKPRGRQILQSYVKWLDRQRVLLGGAYDAESQVTKAGACVSVTDRGDDDWRLHARKWLEAKIKEKFPYHFNRFQKFLRKDGHTGTRASLAWARVVDPLLDCRDSCGVERCWSELKDDELENFIEAGVIRETILLSRSPDVMRIQEIEETMQVEPHKCWETA